MTSNFFRCLLAGCLLAFCAQANVALPAILTDHMVVQRNLPVHVWGSADPAESVTVTFRGESRTTAADDLGRWSLYLPPGEAGGPFEMAIHGNNSLTLADVLVGDVWIASGQSNMEFPLSRAENADAEAAQANRARMRLFMVQRKSAHYPLEDVDAKPWASCTPESAAAFSAVAYFFGRELEQRENVPIGLIESNWGGTPVEAWTSLRAISSDAGLMPVFAWWANMTDDTVRTELRRQKEWQELVARAKAEGKPEPSRPWSNNLDNSWMPAGLYNAMIAPLTPFAIRGAIWYQGESNASEERASLYARLFQAMITDWRRAWGEGNFPFLFVQLANFKAGPSNRWPELREAQLQTLALANTGMAVTTDIGNPDDIHPKDKKDVGLRLSLAARAIAYGEQIEYSGPVFRQAVPEGSTIRVEFDHTGSGLKAWNGELRGFEIAGADAHFLPAEAHIDGRTVVVSSKDVPKPVFVRYAWGDNPDGSLHNIEALPASPFRTGE